MGRNILFLFVLCLFIFKTTAVNMCTNQSSSGRDVSLSLVPETDVSGCNCSVKTDNIGSDKPKMFFEVVNFSGCKYTLVISYNDTKNIISCSNNNTVFFHINKTDEIQLYLESTTSQDKTTTFEVKINSSVTANRDPSVLLECFPAGVDSTVSYSGSTTSKSTTLTPSSTKASIPASPEVSTSSPSTVTTTGSTPNSSQVSISSSSSVSTTGSTPNSSQVSISSSSSVSTTGSTPNSSQVSISSSSSVSTTGSTPNSSQVSISSSSSVSTTGSTPNSSQVSISSSSSVSMTGSTQKSLQISNKPTTGNDVNETNTESVTKPGGDDIDIGIIGGAVGGGLLLIIVIIIIIICVVKKRRKKNRERRDYNRPTVTGSQHDYTDIDLGDKGNNSSSRQSDNTDQKANSPVEIEIIENDLYVSSNDIMDPKSRDNNNTNQTTDANNGPVEMEIIENDLYVSSNEALNSTSHDNNGPLYAEVNKKPKSRKSDQTDKSKGIAVYTDSDLGAKSNNLSSRQSDNTEQNTNSPVENQKTDANNDLYVSSSEALNSHDNDGPHYSSVNKKPKPPISNHADNSNGITGEDHHDTLL